MNMRFKFYVHVVCVLILLFQGRQLTAAVQASPEDIIYERERRIIGSIQEFIRRPCEERDKQEAKRLFNDVCEQYKAYKEGNGECPGEILWFWTGNPEMDRSLFEMACVDDALAARAKREKNILKLCLVSELKLPRDIDDATWDKFKRIHGWVWEARPSQEEVLVAISKVPMQHEQCKSIQRAIVSSWCRSCKTTLRQVVSDRIIRRVEYLRAISESV